MCEIRGQITMTEIKKDKDEQEAEHLRQCRESAKRLIAEEITVKEHMMVMYPRMRELMEECTSRTLI